MSEAVLEEQGRKTEWGKGQHFYAGDSARRVSSATSFDSGFLVAVMYFDEGDGRRTRHFTRSRRVWFLRVRAVWLNYRLKTKYGDFFFNPPPPRPILRNNTSIIIKLACNNKCLCGVGEGGSYLSAPLGSLCLPVSNLLLKGESCVGAAFVAFPGVPGCLHLSLDAGWAPTCSLCPLWTATASLVPVFQPAQC